MSNSAVAGFKKQKINPRKVAVYVKANIQFEKSRGAIIFVSKSFSMTNPSRFSAYWRTKKKKISTTMRKKMLTNNFFLKDLSFRALDQGSECVDVRMRKCAD
jgi:hypothetical protein